MFAATRYVTSDPEMAWNAINCSRDVRYFIYFWLIRAYEIYIKYFQVLFYRVKIYSIGGLYGAVFG